MSFLERACFSCFLKRGNAYQSILHCCYVKLWAITLFLHLYVNRVFPFEWVSGRFVEAVSKQRWTTRDRTSMGRYSQSFPRQKWRSVPAEMGEGRESGIGQRTMDERGKSMKPNSYSLFFRKDRFTNFCLALP